MPATKLDTTWAGYYRLLGMGPQIRGLVRAWIDNNGLRPQFPYVRNEHGHLVPGGRETMLLEMVERLFWRQLYEARMLEIGHGANVARQILGAPPMPVEPPGEHPPMPPVDGPEAGRTVEPPAPPRRPDGDVGPVTTAAAARPVPESTLERPPPAAPMDPEAVLPPDPDLDADIALEET